MRELEPIHKDLKFTSEKNFKAWLKQMTCYIVEFEDDGQDFLKWHIDGRGEVIHCEPFQAFVWNGYMVDVTEMKVGLPLPLQNETIIIHNVKSIKRINQHISKFCENSKPTRDFSLVSSEDKKEWEEKHTKIKKFQVAIAIGQ